MANKVADVFTAGILTLSIALNIGLAAKVHRQNGLLTPPPLDVVAAGSQILPLDAQDLIGNRKHIVFASADKPVVLYVFSPACGWCAKNLNNIKELYALKHDDYKFIAVSLSPNDLTEYISQTSFPLEVMKEPSKESIHNLHLGSTPETIVIDRSGAVNRVWSGGYDAGACREIEKFFQIPDNSLTKVL
jgi:hypothetical protein